MTRYVLIAALSACLGLGGHAWVLQSSNAALKDRNAALTLLKNACNERVENILRDKESDDEVDRIPDDGLRNVPDGWLLRPGNGGVY